MKPKPTRTKMRCTTGSIALCLLVTACGSSSGVGKSEFAQWQAAEVNEYTFTYKVGGGVGVLGPKTVRVSNGVVTEVISEPDGFSLPDYTLADLFVQVDEADVVVSAHFDPELGYPIFLDLDPNESAIDDEFSITVVSFENEADD